MDPFVLIPLALVVGLSFGAARVARRHGPRRQAVAFVGGLVAFIVAVCWAIMGFLYWGFNCDESCDEQSPDWWDTRDAWQWDALMWVALAGAAAVIATVFLAAARRRAWWASAAAAIACAAAFFAILASAGDRFV